MAAVATERLHIVLRGAVQGIGLRPTIYRIAQTLRLAGWVRDHAAGIEVEVQGGSKQIATFLRWLRSDQPNAAVVVTVEVERIALQPDTWFEMLSVDQGPSIPAATSRSAVGS